MQFISILRRRTEAFPQSEFEKYLEAEAEAVRELYARGVARAVWSREDALGAVMLLETDSLEAARAVVADLPLNRRGMLELEKLIPLKGYRGFGPRA